MKIKKKIVKCAFLEYMWHVMVHRKHSRLAKAPSSFKMTARPFPWASHWMSFSLLSFGGASFQRASRSRGRGRTAGRPCNEGEGSSGPLLLSIHKLVWVFFLLVLVHSQPLMLQPVHPERVLGGGVGKHHVGVIEHVQSVQGERVDLQLVQRELRVCVKADITNPRQRVGQLFGEARRRLPCDWDTWHQRKKWLLTSGKQNARLAKSMWAYFHSFKLKLRRYFAF